MNKDKQQKIDQHNYEYWLRENTASQKRAIPIYTRRRKKLTTRSQVALALMASCGIGEV